MKLNLLNDMARTCRLLSLLLLLAVGLAGCKTSRHSSSLSGESVCLSSKVQLTVPHNPYCERYDEVEEGRMHADFLSDADTSYGGGTYGSHPG